MAELNAPQHDAVTTLSGPLLVLAGAGTGKTRVITFRMAELIRSGVAPDRILSVTFTNKAAREMLARTLELLGRRPKRRPWISTFHSLCVKILREDIVEIGYPADFTIYDRGDQESAARKALREVRIGEKQMRPADLLNAISRWKMVGVSPQLASKHTENDLDFLAAVAYRKYQSNLRACGAVDFDDLLLLTLQLFRECPDILEKNQNRFSHVQIDEYQDTNGTQFELVQALVASHRNLCVVGDDDQSIYGWRGAEVEHILNFQHHFPGAKVVRLEDNYRCTQQILDLANCLVRHNRSRHDKVLRAHKRSPHNVRCFAFEDEKEEAETVVEEIRDLIQRKNVIPDDIAILFRTNEQPRIFETELRRHHVPYVILGGQSFFDRREIRDLLAYVKVLAQPADEVSLLRILNVPARGIGDSTREKLLARAVNQGQRFWDVIPEAVEAGEISKRAGAVVEEFRELLDRYRRQFRESPSGMAETMHALIDEIDYHGEIEKQYKEVTQQQVRMNMVEQFVEAIREYAARAESPSLTNFLEESALVGQDDDFKNEDPNKQSGVRLMTLHSAKGLEFPHVYLVGLEEGLLPHQRAVDGLDSAIDEERRLAYVGITRAKDFLTLSRAESRFKWGKRRESVPSRFLWEMRNEAEFAPVAAEAGV